MRQSSWYEGNFVEYNIIRNAMSTLNDGGAIYTNCSRSTIRNNIIQNTKGGMESSGPWAVLAHGIWPEFLGDFKESVIENNTVSGSGGFGLFLTNNFSCRVRGNVMYNNGRAGMELSGEETNAATGRTENLPQNNLIESNVFFGASRNQPAILFRPEYNYGTLSGNYYCNPYRDTIIQAWGTCNKKWSTNWLDMVNWRATYSWADDDSRTDLVKIAGDNSSRGQSKLLINYDTQSKAITVGDNGVYITLDGDTIKGSMELAPFTSAVIVHTGLTHSVSASGCIKNVDKVTCSSRSRKVEINLKLSRERKISLQLFDIKGRTVQKRSIGTLSSGFHLIKMNLESELAHGVYYLEIESGNQRLLKNRIILR